MNAQPPISGNGIAEAIQLGISQQRQGRLDLAEKTYRHVLEAEPDNFVTLRLLGIVADQTERHELAISCFEKSLSIRPDFVEAHNSLGVFLSRRGRVGESVEHFKIAIGLRPDYVEAHNNLGISLHKRGDFQGAIAAYREAISIDPGFAEAHYNLALSNLQMGEFAQGWKGYEWRWEKQDLKAHRRTFASVRWTGNEPLRGKSILLYAEQGFGDTLQFCRYATRVSKLGATVVLQVQKELRGVVDTLAGVDKIITTEEPAPSCDFHCPLLSLPLAFGTTLETIPAEVPYLSAKAAIVGRWRNVLGEKRGLRIGLAWTPNLRAPSGVERSMELSEFIKAIPDGAHCTSLQKDLSIEDRAIVEKRPDFRHFGAGFEDTAALVELMDVIVSVDTAIAHLAGAMGKDVLILSPHISDWRWLLGAESSPWYPKVRIFRQAIPGDWDGVVRRVHAELVQWSTP